MQVLDVSGLPEQPSAAAALFYAEWPAKVHSILNRPVAGKNVVLAFEPADHRHTAWRLAAVQGLARDHAPVRINAISGGSAAARAAACAYLAAGAGITGQYLPLDDAGAGSVVSSAA